MPLLLSSSGPFSKDSCHFCFETQSDGLFLSTVSNRSYCANHLQLHQAQYPGDEYYVKILKTKKQKEINKEPKENKILKLEINYDSESDLFETSYSVVQYTNDGLIIDVADVDPETQLILNKVKTSTSLNKSQELKSWQLEIEPCPHTVSYEPTWTAPVSIDLNHLKCASCELDQNLWLCLICGALGCGRAQFGGVPGNTHALAHSQGTGHTIAVKLGSLSKEVQDVYCYECDEEVSFPHNLPGVLKDKFGIDLDSFEKKEKGLLEMQIEQNLEWEFNLTDSNGEVLQKLFGPGLTGLKNLGNSCYLNSVVQLLFSIPEYRERFNVAFIKESQGNADEDLQFELTKIANGLLSGQFSKANVEENDGFQKGISPESFKLKISEGHEEFRSMKQQDSMEFFSYLLDKIDKLDPELNDVFKFVNLEKFQFPEDSTYKLKNQLAESVTIPIKIEPVTKTTEEEEEQTENQEDVPKSSYKPQSFKDALAEFLQPEEIQFNSKTALKSNYFKTFPKYLITSVQRIQLDESWNPIKVDVPVIIPSEIDIRSLQPDQISTSSETEIQDDDENDNDTVKEEFVPHEASLEQLITMGFPVQRAKRALFENNNNPNVEEVMEWLFQRMEDSSLDEPFDFTIEKKKSSGGSASAPTVDQEKVAALGDMGFSAKLATKALILNNHDVNAAVEWLFTNPGDDGELPQDTNTGSSTTITPEEKISKLEEQDSDVSSKYILKSVICHKGTQVTSGHYVVFIKDEEKDKWVLFNDEKVVDVTDDKKSWSEIERNGYVYLFKRV